jgi:hypothetical protein
MTERKPRKNNGNYEARTISMPEFEAAIVLSGGRPGNNATYAVKDVIVSREDFTAICQAIAVAKQLAALRTAVPEDASDGVVFGEKAPELAPPASE